MYVEPAYIICMPVAIFVSSEAKRGDICMEFFLPSSCSTMVRCLCVMDSIGKTAGAGASRQYWKDAKNVLRQNHNMDLDVKFLPGAGLHELCEQAIGVDDTYDYQLLLSFANDLVTQAGQNVQWSKWQVIKPRMLAALGQLSDHWRGRAHEIVFGGIGDMWEIPKPEIFNERVIEILHGGQNLNLSMRPASEWLQQLKGKPWKGFHFDPQFRQMAVNWLVENIVCTCRPSH